MAANTPCAPAGKSPPTAKLWRSNPWMMKAAATMSGTAIFHQTTTVFVSRNHRMPAAFNAVNPSSTNTATSWPSGVSRTTPGDCEISEGA